MKRHRNKLLIALVLLTVLVAVAWTPSRSDASGILSQQVWDLLDGPDQNTIYSAGDPDIGQGMMPQAPSVKRLRRLLPSGDARPVTFAEWVRWTSRIWVTLHLRIAR